MDHVITCGVNGLNSFIVYDVTQHNDSKHRKKSAFPPHVTLYDEIKVQFGCSVRVARLAFVRPNSRNLPFFKVVWHEKMVFGMYVIVWHIFGLF